MVVYYDVCIMCRYVCMCISICMCVCMCVMVYAHMFWLWCDCVGVVVYCTGFEVTIGFH